MRKQTVTMMGLALMIGGAVTLLPRPTTAVADPHEGGNHELHETMEDMNGLYRQIRRQARDEAQNDDTADKLHELATLALSAKAHIPGMVGEAPEGERENLANSYRMMMNELVTDLLAAETAILSGDNAAAWDAILEANDVKGRGHELFIPEDE